MNGELAQVGGDPFAAQLFGHGGGSTGAAEEVGDQVAFVGRSSDDAFKESFRFLSGIARPFVGNLIDALYVIPNVANVSALLLV